MLCGVLSCVGQHYALVDVLGGPCVALHGVDKVILNVRMKPRVPTDKVASSASWALELRTGPAPSHKYMLTKNVLVYCSVSYCLV